MAKKIQDTIKFVGNPDNLMSFGKSFATLNGQPLDKDSIFSTKAAAEAYAKSASAYVGKIVVVAAGTAGQEVVTAYVINSDNTLKAIGDKGTMDDLASKITALQQKDEEHDNSITALGQKDTEIEAKADANANAILTKADKTAAIGTVEAGLTADKIVVKAVDGAGKDATITVNDVAHAVKADNLGEHAAVDYQLAAELKALAKKDKVAEGDLETELATKINNKADATAVEQVVTDYKAADAEIKKDVALKAVKTDVDNALKLKADKTYVDEQLKLKATEADQKATEAKAEQNKTDIARVEKEYKEADTALDTRLKAAEGKLKDVTNVMDFVGAVDKLPAGEELKKYQKGDVIVVTGGAEAGLEYVYDGAKFVEIGNSSSEQAAIAELKEKDKTHDDLLAGLRTDVDLKATQAEVNTLSGKVDKKAEQSALEAATKRITDVEGEVDTLNAKPAFGITSDQISNWDGEVGALAQANTNKQGLADLKAVVEDPASGLAATKVIADKNKEDIATNAVAIAAEKGALAKATANETAIGELQKADTKHTEDIAKNAQDIAGKEAAGTAKGLIDALIGEVTGTPAADSTITALAQANGKVTATVGKIAIAETQVTGLADKLSGLRTDIDTKQTADQVNALIGAAEIAQDQVTGLPKALSDLTAKDGELAGKITALDAVKPAEVGAQVNKIESIKVDGVAINIEADKSVALPKAMAAVFGLVKGNNAENGIEVNEGLMSVHSLNVNKLVQTPEEELILNGGSSADVK